MPFMGLNLPGPSRHTACDQGSARALTGSVCRAAGSGRYLTTVNSRYLAGVTGPPGPASGTGQYSSQGGVDIAKAPTGASTSGPLGDTKSYNAKGASGSTSPNPAGEALPWQSCMHVCIHEGL